MTGRLTQDELRAWQALLHAHHDVVEALDSELREKHGLSFGAYDVLLRLGRSPGRELRMSELASRVMLSPSALTRKVDRLERQELVRRSGWEGDARVVLVRLTDPGLRLLRRAASTHLRGIREHFTGRLTRQQLRQIVSALETIAGPHHAH